MRKMLGAALLGLTVAGGAVIAGSAAAQPYGYYYSNPPGYYDNGYYRAPLSPYSNGYYAAPGYAYPGYTYYDPYGTGVAGAVIGAVIGNPYAYMPGVPVDRYGPDPNGMIAPDGHKIKCKLRNGYDAYGRYGTHRECW